MELIVKSAATQVQKETQKVLNMEIGRFTKTLKSCL